MYPISSRYNEVIYSGEAQHRLSLLFNEVEYENANAKVEYVKIKSNILSNGDERFSLDNFVSKEVEIKIHEIDLEDIVEPVNISIETLIDGNYESVPIGIFNLSEAPTKDGNTATIKLRDNAVKFDTPYNAEEIIKENENQATMLQILQDICNKCNVVLETTEFLNSDTKVSVWDNTINARQYVMYIAEKAGCIATISRTGGLLLIPINGNLSMFSLDTYLIESFIEGDKFIISRVVYEDAIRKFEHGEIPQSGDWNEDRQHTTLYVNSSNPYITDDSEIEEIYNSINGFSICGMKITKIIGNPALDHYDLITFTYKNKTYVTFAQNELLYNGGITQSFNTNIGTLEKAQENVTISSEESRFKRVFTNINQLEGTIQLHTSQITETSEILSQTIQSVTNIQNLFQITGGNNMIKDSQLLLGDEGRWEYTQASADALYPSSILYPHSSKQPIEHYNLPPNYVGGYDATLIGKTVSISKIGISNGKMVSSQTNITGLIIDSMYTLSYKITNEPNTTTIIRLLGNNNTIYKETFTSPISMQEHVFSFVAQTSTYILEIQSISNQGNFCYIYDLMLNKGDVQTWEPAAGEIVSTVLKLSQLGLQIYSTGSDIATLMTSQGFQINRFQNGTMFEIITEFTSTGLKTKMAEVVSLLIHNFVFKEINYQGYETLVLYKREGDS